MTTDVAHKVFNQMPNSPPIVVRQEEVSNCILAVDIHEVVYPMTKHVFHMIFDPYVGDKGLLMMVLENIDHVMAFVAFSSQERDKLFTTATS